MKKIFLFILTLHYTFFSVQCRAQKQGQTLIDSLLKELPRQKEDTNKVKLLTNISGYYPTISPDEGIKFGQQGLALAIKLGWEKGIARSYGQLALNYHSKAEYPKAIENNFKALKLYEELGDKVLVTAATCNIGRVYSFQEDYPRALEYFSKALKLAKEIGHKEYAANIICNIAYVYHSQNNSSMALEYNFKALKLYEELGDKGRIAMAAGNIGSTYSEQGKYAMAIEYKQRALKLATEIGDKSTIATNLSSIGATYLDIVNDTSAKKGDIKDATAVPENTSKPTFTIPRGKAALLAAAIDFEQRSLALCKEIKDLETMSTCYVNLVDAYSLKGDYKKAMEYQANYQAIKDSTFSAENNKSIMEQGVKYEYEKKEAVAKAVSEKEIQKQKLVRNSVLVGFIVMLIFAVVFFTQRNKISKEKDISEKERKRSDELLLNILPAEVAEELKAKGSAEAQLIDEVTVLFTDFKGFTQLSEKLSPKELVADIHDCFSAFDHIMNKHGVEKIKTIGDAYMAAGGLPTANKTHAQDVVNAAIDIQQFMHEHKSKREAEGKLFFEIRIGVHTGPVVAGIVGVKKFAYDIWGDTVNTAARMEQHSEAGKVNISGSTYELVKDQFHCAHRGKISAKGKGEMEMYFVEK